MKASPSEVSSYVGSITAVTSSLTLSDLGIIVGITTALATLFVNVVYMYRKDRREQRESLARLHEMEVASE